LELQLNTTGRGPEAGRLSAARWIQCALERSPQP